MFLLRPPPLSGESLSSWRQRAGEMNGFWRYPRAPGKSRHKDPDRLRDDQEARWLCNEFSLSEDALRCLTLEHRLHALGITVQETTKLRWVLPLNVSPLGSSGRSMYCPHCLLEDETPYFRLDWRFAFTTQCERHRCALKEQCPTCGSPVWPTSDRTNSLTAWLPLTACRVCRSSLVPRTCAKNRLILKCESHYSNIEIEGKSLDELWYLAQLLLRSRSRRLQKYVFERAHINHTEVVSACTIEHLPLSQRGAIIAASAWLLQDWPVNFLSAADDCEISLEAFSGTLHLASAWIQDVVRSRLVKRDRNKVTNEAIGHAIAKINKEGGTISKSAIRRILQVSESSLLNRMIAHRRRATVDEAQQLLLTIENAVTHAKASRSHRSALLRDCFIFLLSMISGERIEELCKVTRAQADYILSNATSTEIDMPAGAHALAIYIYEEIMRTSPNEKRSSNEPLLLSRWGEPILGHGVRQRISFFLRSGFPDDLWHSADAFR